MYSKKWVLIVDDNDMNRKMTSRLLDKMDVEWDEAKSGYEALEKVAKEEYMLLLMDYRMPEIDGIETTRRIRKMEGDYFQSLPIIAMTAEEREEMQEQFLQTGMNAILQKPLQAEQVKNVFALCLPEMFSDNFVKEKELQPQELLTTDYVERWKLLKLDAKEGVKNCGEKALFESLVRDFYYLVDSKAIKLVKAMVENQQEEYTIEVHALKNTARLIGAMELSEQFALLEKWGNSGSMEEVKKFTPGVLATMHQYKLLLQPFVNATTSAKKEVPIERIKELLYRVKDAVEVFDLDGVDEAMVELDTYEMPVECKKQMEKLKAYVADVALEDILKTITEMIPDLEKAE